MNVLICGGRHYDDKVLAWQLFDQLHAARPVTLVVHGACPVGHGGADMLADAWARTRGIKVQCYPINRWLDGDWPTCGRARNIRMWEDCKSWINGGVALSGGFGTKHMVSLMEADGIEVWKPLDVCP
jgi:hypothetical protein